MMKAALNRSTRQTAEQLQNINVMPAAIARAPKSTKRKHTEEKENSSVKKTLTADPLVQQSPCLGSDTVVTPPEKKRKSSGRSGGNYCVKCSNTSKTRTDLSFRALPSMPKEPPTGANFERVKKYHAQKFRHDEMMRRVGRRGQICSNLRLCSIHRPEILRETIGFQYKGKRYSQLFEFTVCPAFGNKLSKNPSETTKGVGWDRERQGLFKNIHKQIEDTAPGSLEREALEGRFLKQQQAEEWRSVQSPIACPETLRVAGIINDKKRSNSGPSWPFHEVHSSSPKK